ncbi:unnamed protein product [Eruca vesicaria subsp. sativa]|uniref:RRM domain-containing protein n=1 Tax=Eruca vesicaria subsp. sativa TaxID=29727 RepID=A0ABC8JTE6_ERUVS|nr:unnamed protein product [Eruca vesicaria subsp. sativa]
MDPLSNIGADKERESSKLPLINSTDSKLDPVDESPLAEPSLSFAEWVSSSSESELEDYYLPDRLVMWNLDHATVKLDIEVFFNNKTANVIIADEPIRTAEIWFNSLQDTKEGLKKHGELLGSLPVRIKRVPTTRRRVFSVSGFEPGLPEELIKEQLKTFFKSCGVIRKIFIPKDKNTGGCLSFGYVFMNQRGGKAEKKDNNEMEGRTIRVSDCTNHVRYRVIKAAMKAEGYEETEKSEDDSDSDDGEDDYV